jgi:hypothetical protein
MIGNRHNNITQKSGQVLLLAAMILATLLTLSSAVVFRSTTETQITKLEEESQKALAAAEAAIEVALKQGNVSIENDLPNFQNSNITGQATVDIIQSNEFVTPLLQKDEQYTLYLSNPGGTVDNPNFSVLNSYYNNQALTICSTSPTVSLEITLIKRLPSGNYQLNRFAINPPGSTIIEGNNVGVGSSITDQNKANCPAGENFTLGYQYQLSNTDIGSNNLLLIARAINGLTKIGFKGSDYLPLQGKKITSTAKSSTGVTKRVELFQSYPQIPSDFFVTSF